MDSWEEVADAEAKTLDAESIIAEIETILASGPQETPGDFYVTRRSLQRRFGVSKATVLKALQKLSDTLQDAGGDIELVAIDVVARSPLTQRTHKSVGYMLRRVGSDAEPQAVDAETLSDKLTQEATGATM